MSYTRKNLQEAFNTLNKFYCHKQMESVDRFGALLVKCLREGGKIITCGNGGSYCDALHFTSELTGKFSDDRIPLASICLSDAAHITCVGNDYGWESVFKRGVTALARPGDILLGFSTSGNSKNVVMAVHEANERGMTTLAVLGKSGGELAELAMNSIVVESQSTARVQEIHGLIVHLLVEYIEREMFPKNYEA